MTVSFNDAQLQTLMAAACGLPPDVRPDFLQVVSDQLCVTDNAVRDRPGPATVNLQTGRIGHAGNEPRTPEPPYWGKRPTKPLQLDVPSGSAS